MPERKTKSFGYRRAEGLLNGRTLQAVLEPVLYNSHRLVGQRAEDVQDEHGGALRRCINLRHRGDGMLFGEFILYVAGTNKQVITVQENQEHLQVDQLQPPPDENGNAREFIDAVLYFGIQGNHIVVVQSAALRDRDLELHLNWLLFHQAEALEDGESVMLRKELSLQGRRALRDVRSVSISAPLIERVGAAGAADGANQRRMAVNVRGQGLRWLRRTFGGDFIDQLDVRDLAGSDELEVQISIVGKGGSRLSGTPAGNTIAALTVGLRHQYEDDIRIQTGSGPIRGRKIFLRNTRSVNCLNGVPDPYNVFDEMRDWLGDCLEQELVDP